MGILNRFNEMVDKEMREAKAHKKKLVKGRPQDAEKVSEFSARLRRRMHYDLILADNTTKQALEVLEKKQNYAQRMLEYSEKFWKKAKKRQDYIKKKLKHSTDPSDEEKLLKEELDILQHIEFDAQRIDQALTEKREHDIKPLLVKAAHASKLINAEERIGALDPGVLKQYQVYEKSILEKISKLGISSYDLDEFKAVEKLMTDLKKETAMLNKKNRQLKSPSHKKRLKKRVNEILAEILILENMLKLSRIEKLSDRNFQKNAMKIYDVIKWLEDVEEQEKRIIGK